MKYIQKFAEKLSEDVTIKHNTNTTSVYIVLDKCFVIRLSDHLSPSDARTGINVNVVKVWGGDDFVVIFSNTLNPMVKNRKEVKDYIAFCYNNWKLEKITAESRAKWSKTTKGLSNIDKYVFDIFEKHATLKVYKEWKQIHSVLGGLYRFKPLNKDIRRLFEIYYNNSMLDVEDIVRLTYEDINAKSTKEDAISRIEEYIKNKKADIK